MWKNFKEDINSLNNKVFDYEFFLYEKQKYSKNIKHKY